MILRLLLILLLVFKDKGDHHKKEWRVDIDIRVDVNVDVDNVDVDADNVLAYGARDVDANTDVDFISANGCDDNMDWYRRLRLLIVFPINVTPGLTNNWNDSTTAIGNIIINKNNKTKTKQILFSYFQSSHDFVKILLLVV